MARMLTHNVRRLIINLVFGLPLFALFYGIHVTEPPPEKGHKIKFYFNAASEFPHKPVLWAWTGGGLLIAVLLSWALYKIFSREFAGAAFKKHLRGTKLVSATTLIAKTKEVGKQQIHIAGVPMPTRVEAVHTLIGGATGTGKTTGFNEILLDIRRRGDRMIITDPDGGFLSRFYKPGDVILNPYDARTQGWNFFNEVRNSYDFKSIMESVVPKSSSAEQEEWNGYGRLLLTETARKLAYMGSNNVRELFRWCTIAEPDDLKAFLEGTDAESLFVGAEKALASARFVVSKYLPEHINMPAGTFSIRDWLDDPNGGNLYLTWREDMLASLRPLVSCWFDIFCRAILSVPESEAQSIWGIIDELESLDKLATLNSAMTKGRKHGLRIVAGLQTTSQMDKIFGKEEAITLRGSFRNLLVLGNARPDADTPEFFSKALGEHDVLRDNETHTNRVSTTEKHEKERTVLPSEITALPDLHGYLSFSGSSIIGKVELTTRVFKKQTDAFIDRPPLELHTAEIANIF